VILGNTLSEAKILIVDDEQANVRVLERLLAGSGSARVVGTTDPRDALPLFHELQPDLILLDLHMPHLDGLSVLEQLRKAITEDDFVPVLVLTADVTREAKEQALRSGAKDFLTKPFDFNEVLLRSRNLLETRSLHLLLEQRVEERTRELDDLGKVGIPDDILLKPGRLSPDEFEVMKTHTTLGAELLSGGRSPLMRKAEQIALSHHERWDGGGYPQGLEGEDIPLSARIVAVVDFFDALSHDRPYRSAMPFPAVVDEMEAQRGKHFDPMVLAAFLEVADSIRSDPAFFE
jgi:putative two-component system response regulator